jgi:energy-converting hydrogenase Eha subunit C
MINNDRIVPIQKIDYLSMIGTILGLHGTSYNVLGSLDTTGDFKVTGTGDAGNILANQPVKSLDFASGVTAGVVYFVAAYDFDAITVAGAAATMGSGSATVVADGITLYKATLASGEVTVSVVTPALATE